MHTEHISNLHPGWVVGGWLVAVAVSGLLLLIFVAVGLVPAGADLFVLLALAAGFFAGGLFVGLRWSNAPILHGVAITVLSVLVWFVGAWMAPGTFGGASGAPTFVLGSILLQLVTAIAGGWTGRALVRRGEVPTLEA